MALSTREKIRVSQILDIVYPNAPGGNTSLRVIDSTMRGSILITGDLTTGTPTTIDTYITTYIDTDTTKEAMVRDYIAEWEDIEQITAKVSGGNAAIGALQGASWDPAEQRKWIRHRMQALIPYYRPEEYRREFGDGKHSLIVPGVR